MGKPYRSKEQARLYWQDVLERWQESGLTISQFCREHQITDSGFYTWRKKLLASSSAVEAGGSKNASFVQIDMQGAKQSSMTLKLTSGHTLQIANQVNTEALVKVLRALQEAKLC